MNLMDLYITLALDDKGFNSKVKNIVGNVAGIKAVAFAFDTVRNSISGAIERYDTLSRFPVVMKQMGYGADVSQKSIDKLSDSIQGLPTSLNDIVTSTKNIALMTGDLDKATDTAIALNNAFLASGSNSENAARGMIQYNQQLAKGKPDMQSWRTLQETMGYALRQTAESFGFAGESATTDFYDALRDGDITFSQFNDRLIELNNQTGGFAETAKVSSAGLKTDFTNAALAVTRGVASVISGLQEGGKEFGGIGGIVSSVALKFEAFLKSIGETAKSLSAQLAPAVKTGINLLGGIMNATGKLLTPASKLAPVVVGIAAAYKTWSILNTAGNWIATLIGNISKVIAAKKAYNVAISQSVAMTGLSATATKADAFALTEWEIVASSYTGKKALKTAADKLGMSITAQGTLMTEANTVANTKQMIAVMNSAGALSAKSVIVGALTGKITWATAAQWLWNAAMAANPVGLVAAGIVVLTAGIAALAIGISKANPETRKFNEELKEIKKTSDELSESIDDLGKSFEQSNADRRTEYATNTDLIKSLDETVKAYDGSASARAKIQMYVDSLNKSMADLNLEWREESNSLSMSNEELETRAANLYNVAKAEAYREQVTELIRKQNEQQLILNKTQELFDERAEKMPRQAEMFNKALEEGLNPIGQYDGKLFDLFTVMKEGRQNIADLENQIEELTNAYTESAVETEKATGKILSYSELVLNRQKEISDERAEIEEQAIFRMTEAANRYGITLEEYQDRVKEAEETKREQLDETADTFKKNLDNETKELDKALKAQSKALSEAHKERERETQRHHDAELKSLDNAQKAQLKNYQSSLDEEMKAFERASSERIKLIDEEYTERLKLIDEAKYNQIKAIDDEIKSIQDTQTAEDKAAKALEEQQKLRELRESVAIAKTLEERTKAEKALKDYEKQLADARVKEDRQNRINALNEQKNNINEEYKAQVDVINAELNEKKSALQEHLNAEKEALKESQSIRLENFKEAQAHEKEGLKENHSLQMEQLKAAHEQEQENLSVSQEAQKSALQEIHALKIKNIEEAQRLEMERFKENYNEQKRMLEELYGEGDFEATGERLGLDLSDGLINGLNKRMEELRRMSREMADNAYDPAAEELEVHSPSKKFGRLAKWVVEGYNGEFVKGIKGVLHNAQAFASDLIQTFGGIDLDNTVPDFGTKAVAETFSRHEGTRLMRPDDFKKGMKQTINITQDIKAVPMNPFELAEQSKNSFSRAKW